MTLDERCSVLAQDVGRRLRDERARRGMTQAALSGESGVAQADISRIESGRANPGIRTLAHLAEAMNAALVFSFCENS